MEPIVKQAFDRSGKFALTTDEVDQLLSAFDQSPPALQRQVIAVFVTDSIIGKSLLQEVYHQIGNATAEDGGAILTSELRQSIRDFIF